MCSAAVFSRGIARGSQWVQMAKLPRNCDTPFGHLRCAARGAGGLGKIMMKGSVNEKSRMNTVTFNAHARRFVQAALRGDLDAARELLARHPDLIRNRNNTGETPLHYLAVEDCQDGAEMLIAAGAAVDSHGTHEDVTPLYDVAGLGLVALAQLLIRHGADVTRKQAFVQETALHAAARHSPTAEIIDVLIDAGADVNARDRSQRTPLHVAAFAANVRTARRLIERGSDLSLIDEFDETPAQALRADASEELRTLLTVSSY